MTFVRSCLGLALLTLACSSEEFESKAASNEDSGLGGGSSGSGGNGGSGGSIADGASVDGPVVSCDLDAGLDTEGCACSLQGDTKGCYLGKPGPQSACTQGNQTCDAGVWGPCVGATSPSDEKCGDEIDNDCDGIVDNGCLCTSSTDLCKNRNGILLPAGDNVFVDKDVVSLGDTLHVYVVSTSPVPNIACSMSSPSTPLYCAGQGGVSSCTAGDGCDGWHAAVITLTIGEPPFHPGEPAEITVYIDDPDAPCDGARTKKVTVQVQ